MTFFCWVRISSLFAKFFFSSLNQISIILQSYSCSLYFLASRLQWVSYFSRLLIFLRSFARSTSSLWRRASSFFQEKRSKERSFLGLDWFLERAELIDLTERLELARFKVGWFFYSDFLEVVEFLIEFLPYWECLLLLPTLFLSFGYLGFKAVSVQVLILRSVLLSLLSSATLGLLLSPVSTLTVLLMFCSLASCFFFQTALCISSQSSLSSSSSSQSQSEGQEY